MFYCKICGDWMDCWNDCENCDTWIELYGGTEIMPTVNFDMLLNNSKDALFQKIYKNPNASCFLVYLRCKYSHQTKWEYLIECCELCNQNDIIWFNDWYEGQQEIEYLGVAVINLPERSTTKL